MLPAATVVLSAARGRVRRGTASRSRVRLVTEAGRRRSAQLAVQLRAALIHPKAGDLRMNDV
ncbi:hypothetical protein BU198_36150 [Streptomyces sp. CBMA156]|nr:hypothetical protein [Streptomyces sp. CBMA156]